MQFAEPQHVFRGIDPHRFARLEAFARTGVPSLPLQADAEELGLDLAACLAAAHDQRATAEHASTVFAPFEGHWIGGDLHDASRVYRHIWYPTETAGDFAAQRVLMLDSRDRPTLAYDFCELRDEPRITGLVGDRAHRGYALPGGALLWLGEEREGQISVHLERVRADGQLYDVRGVVVAPTPAGAQVRSRSDWRYHRLRPGAVRSPL